MFGRRFWRRNDKKAKATSALGVATPGAPLREFVYLDDVSVQSLLASLIGTLPSEVTSLSSHSLDAETSGTIGASMPGVAKSELTSRFKSASATSNQVLSRAVTESLFKHLYELISDRLIWPQDPDDPQPLQLSRGSLIEIEVELSPDPVYGFNTTMGVMADLADDYPAMLEDKTAALVLRESGPVTKVLDRLLAGLVPIKATSTNLFAGDAGGTIVAAPRSYFEREQISCTPLTVVGVTEQDKYWRDVRRVLFSKSTFTVLGRIGRSGVQPKWIPVKLAESMREIAPEFPDVITRAAATGYAKPTDQRAEGNQQALEAALVDFAKAAGGAALIDREAEVTAFAHSKRGYADTLVRQRAAFEELVAWLLENHIIDEVPTNARALRQQARSHSGLRASSEVQSLADFASPSPAAEPESENLIDLEIIAIYW